ncbi:ATP phosphoribosyltransferase regulatory subunit [Fluviicoccus keumensis]|uniref:ATP phosphoribosyltransferase regulatory subunit n=1 Tax=Fluviicoccus keumensis TaxID=1435465 RepID=A0A4Q7Z937_9GAMM|nr:ATP phosphoribosyltransferase regulatory subunit [Fluviicoccus keumensis]RZU47032.1 ATP phosphoribosyltransferase regulatory subunit [Fluviicoccus keumensis]
MPRPAETWLLPDGVQDVLPAEAARLESLRRRLLDLFAVWGYELVFPPLMEYLESLLTGSGHDLDLMTFKITDQLSGRLMGVRADITPQVARLDAHCLPRPHAARYCYSGTVLNTRPQSLEASRSPIQIGAELYGHAGVDADIEILRLMLDMLDASGVREVHLDLGHVAIFRELAVAAGLSPETEARLFDIYQRKSLPELQDLLPQLPHGEWFAALGALSGDASVVEDAVKRLAGVPSAVSQALADLHAVIAALRDSHPQVRLSLDLSELRGYHYHTGLVFAAYVSNSATEIAKGGRYDRIGEAFGRARPATGFSADLKALLAHADAPELPQRIHAPAGHGAALRDAIRHLRASGNIVIQALPGDAAQPADLGCTAVLTEQDGQWIATPL